MYYYNLTRTKFVLLDLENSRGDSESRKWFTIKDEMLNQTGTSRFENIAMNEVHVATPMLI